MMWDECYEGEIKNVVVVIVRDLAITGGDVELRSQDD